MKTNKKKPFIPFTKNGGGNKPYSARNYSDLCIEHRGTPYQGGGGDHFTTGGV
jgi:hypothetical protein